MSTMKPSRPRRRLLFVRLILLVGLFTLIVPSLPFMTHDSVQAQDPLIPLNPDDLPEVEPLQPLSPVTPIEPPPTDEEAEPAPESEQPPESSPEEESAPSPESEQPPEEPTNEETAPAPENEQPPDTPAEEEPAPAENPPDEPPPAPEQPVHAPDAPPPGLGNMQMRAIWVENGQVGLHTPQEIDELVNNMVRANANTIIAQVRRHGDAMFNRSIEPRFRHPNLAPAEVFDPLAYLLEKAHAANLKVHAWMVISVVCQGNDQRGHPQHVCTHHGPGTADPWTTADYYGNQIGGLDFGHPAVAPYMEMIVQDMLKNYPTVDGVHYDFIRYGDVSYGYNGASLSRFREAHGLPSTYRPLPHDWLWGQWRRDAITNLVRRLYIRIKQIDPTIEVSMAAITWGGNGNQGDWQNSAAYSTLFQDWRAWLEEGIIDFAVPMHYFQEGVPQHRAWFDQWLAFDRQHAYNRAIVPGNGAWLNTAQQNLDQINRALSPDEAGRVLPGIALYDYNTPMIGTTFEGRRQFMDLLRSTVFASPAQAPEWPWITNPTKGHIQGIATDANGVTIPNALVGLIRMVSGWVMYAHNPMAGLAKLMLIPVSIMLW